MSIIWIITFLPVTCAFPRFSRKHCFNKPLNLKIHMIFKDFHLPGTPCYTVFLFPSSSKPSHLLLRWLPSHLQEVYLRRRACEALGCQGKEMGAIGALALKKAAEDGEKHLLKVGCGVVGLKIFRIATSFFVRDFL